MSKAEERASELHILMWDKDFYNGFIKGYETADRDATIDSLRPQNKWKPSEEQMQVLKRLMPLFIDPKLRNIMEQLINNLQKLREK